MKREPSTENRAPRTENRDRPTAYPTRSRRHKLWLQIALSVMTVLGSWFLVLSPAIAQGQPPDLETYTGWVREAFAAAQRSDRLGLEDAGARLIATTSVR